METVNTLESQFKVKQLQQANNPRTTIKCLIMVDGIWHAYNVHNYSLMSNSILILTRFSAQT